MTAVDQTYPHHGSEGRVALADQLRRAERSRKIRAFGLTVPLILFLLITFAIPIAQVLFQGVKNGEMTQIMPGLTEELETWDGQGMPPERVVESFVRDVAAASENQTLARVAKRLNFSISGYRSLLLKTARRLPSPDQSDLLQALVEIDTRWSERRYWTAMKQASPRFTLEYLLTTVDRQFDADGEIVRKPPETSLYLTVLMRTLWISMSVTLICVIIGYPMAYLLATLPAKYSNILLLLLLLPFWTSLLVRTTAWLVLLQNQGVVNDAGIWLGLWEEPLQLIRNRLGVYIAMVHILLPFMVLPIYSVMKGISPFHLKAAASLGARPVRSFLKVYAPQTIAGVGAGSLLVFIITLGFYITPALVGGPGDQMLSYFIAFSANSTVNWGLAAALSLMLMLCVGVFFAFYSRLVGVRSLGTGS
ncbi:MAG: ABC transporter permease [Phyllobacteriaceae bacterium]|jgi:putative spermidine/putrescine transport system permease protein|nr:ABC transporter permease [Phyllobacteriaceae bacterium]